MKIFMKILVSVFLVAVTLSMLPFQNTCVALQEDVFRLHILANSDSKEDQELKIRVRNEIIKEISPLFVNVKTKQEAMKITNDNLSLIRTIAKNTIADYGYDYDVEAIVKNEFFDTRYYDDFTMPAGFYDSLTITIGDAQGKNWWCVMYPSLCVGASSKINMKEDLSDEEYKVITSSDVTYKFKIVEYYEKVCSFFNR